MILGTIGWLAFTGYGSNKSYYVTIAELGGMGDKAYNSNLRVEGFVKPGSIEQNGTHVTFMLNEFESHSPKAATGRLLDVTTKAPSRRQTLSKTIPRLSPMGTYGRDGVFHANGSRPNAPANTPRASQAQTPGRGSGQDCPAPAATRRCPALPKPTAAN